jgi:hypothetical protein
MSELWEKLDNEPQDAFNAFQAFLETRNRRDSILKLSDKTGFSKSTLSFWKKTYMWAERALAYDKYIEEEQSKARSALIEESAIKYIKALVSRIELMLLSSNIYMKDLKDKGGIEALESLSTFAKREIAHEDLEMAMKLMKTYKELLELTPEGKELLKSGASGTEINITFVEADKNNAGVIDVTDESLQIDMEEAEIVTDED